MNLILIILLFTSVLLNFCIYILTPKIFSGITISMETGAEPAMRDRPHIAIFASPGLGHVIPVINLAKLLVSPCHGFTVTIITASSPSKTQQSLLSSLPSSISTLTDLTPPTINDASEDPVATIYHNILNSIPSIHDTLKQLKSSKRLVAFITDFFGVDFVDTARELGVPFFMFFPTNLFAVSVFLQLPILDRTISCEFKDLIEPIRLPGCVPIHGKDLGMPMQNRKCEAYKLSIHISKRTNEADGMLSNTFYGIEPGVASFFEQDERGRPPVYPIGPLIRTDSGEEFDGDGSGCMEWLDRQPNRSVLFISFGSGGALTSEQMTELAWGLELSRQRFLWVVRNPSDKNDATFFSIEGTDNLYSFLPEGFVERNRELGFVVSSWAPQIKVLGHEATGGFLTHCGWNSVLESVMNGVPMIVWPLYAEQSQNAVMLTEGIGAAIRLESRGDGLVVREEIMRVVRELMEGERGMDVRKKVSELKIEGERALCEDGPSIKNLAKWKESIAV